MRLGSQRAVGGIAFAAAAVVAMTARGFTVGFISDPIGPRALPWLAAGLLALGGLGMAIGRPTTVVWPPPAVRRRLGLAVLALAGFAVLVEPAGFLASAALLGAAFGRLFGARWRLALAVGGLLSLALYGFFAGVLGVALPVGGWAGGR